MSENLKSTGVWTSNCCGVPYNKNGEYFECSYCGKKFEDISDWNRCKGYY